MKLKFKSLALYLALIHTTMGTISEAQIAKSARAEILQKYKVGLLGKPKQYKFPSFPFKGVHQDKSKYNETTPESPENGKGTPDTNNPPVNAAVDEEGNVLDSAPLHKEEPPNDDLERWIFETKDCTIVSVAKKKGEEKENAEPIPIEILQYNFDTSQLEAPPGLGVENDFYYDSVNHIIRDDNTTKPYGFKFHNHIISPHEVEMEDKISVKTWIHSNVMKHGDYYGTEVYLLTHDPNDPEKKPIFRIHCWQQLTRKEKVEKIEKGKKVDFEGVSGLKVVVMGLWLLLYLNYKD